MSVKLIINEPSIGLTDRTTYLNYAKGNSFRLQQGARATATFYFRVSAGDSYAPTIGTPIYFYEVTGGVSTCAFCGTIDQVGPYEWIGNAGDHYVKLTCVSFEQTLDTLIIYGYAYSSTNAGNIVLDLLQRVCSGVPITAGTVSNGASIPSIVFDGVRVSDAIQSLATQSGFIWGIDPVTQSLFFRVNNTSPAPLTITQAQVLWETAKFTQGRQNYRNRQSVRVSFAAFNPSNVFFAGNGATTVFTFPYLAELPLSIIDTTGVQAARVGTFTGQPAANDTITVNTYVYKFVTTLDNTLRNQVLIGANLAATVQNFADAINANPTTAGVGYSLPTWENDVCNADTITGTTLTARTKLKGANQNAFPTTDTSANFSWAGATTTGGTDGVDVVKTLSLLGTGAVTDETFNPLATTGGPPTRANAFIRSTGAAQGTAGDTITVGSTVYTFYAAGTFATVRMILTNVGSFNAGQTIKIGSVTYTFIGTLNNAIPNQIKVGLASASQLQAIADALSANPATSGSFYSSATTANPDWRGSNQGPTIPSGAWFGSYYIDVTATAFGPGSNGMTIVYSGSPSPIAMYNCSAPATSASCGGPNAATLGGGYAFTTANQILANNSGGLSAANFATFVADAINANPSTAGVNFSGSTAANTQATAATTGTSGEVEATSAGTGTSQNSIGVAASLSTATNWTGTSGGSSTSHLVGATDSTLATASQLTASVAPAAGHSLSVSYRRVGTDIISVENTSLVTARASAEHGTGKYQVLKLDTSNTSAVAGLLSAQQNLAAFALLVSSFQFSTDSPGLSPGQYLTVTLASPAPANMRALINGNWIVQQVDAKLLPGMDAAPSPGGHFRYTVSVVSSSILNYLQFWTNLSGGA